MSDPTLQEDRLLINGKLVPASNGATYDNINPATGRVIGVAADATNQDADGAVAAARDAFDSTSWSTDLAFRLHCIRQLQEQLVKHSDIIRQAIVAEVGSPLSLTYGPQLDTPVSALNWVTEMAGKYSWRQELGLADVFGGKTSRYVVREPIGVVAAIVPWNFPMQIQLAKIGPALAAGCTVVLKAAPATPWTATLLGRIAAEETDLPPGVLNILSSSRNEVGQQLVEDARVDLISFTGSTATGRTIHGGCRTDGEAALPRTGGQVGARGSRRRRPRPGGDARCIPGHHPCRAGVCHNESSPSPRSRYEEGLDALVSILQGMPYGDPTDTSNLMGPLISEQQRQRVLGYISSARAEGGTTLLGGGIPSHLQEGFFVEPTVIDGLRPDAAAVREEIFGPVLCVLPYDNDDDAVALANNSIYGLSGAVVSSDVKRAEGVASRLRTGTVSVNGAQWYGPDVPFGGYKQSGLGRESGIAGFEEYLETKSVAVPG